MVARAPSPAGMFRRRVTIERATRTDDGKGGFDLAWATIATVYAQVEGLNGEEIVLASALEGVSSYRVTMRWRAGVLQSDQLGLSDGIKLNIRSANDPDGRRRLLVLLADDEAMVRET